MRKQKVACAPVLTLRCKSTLASSIITNRIAMEKRERQEVDACQQRLPGKVF